MNAQKPQFYFRETKQNSVEQLEKTATFFNPSSIEQSKKSSFSLPNSNINTNLIQKEANYRINQQKNLVIKFQQQLKRNELQQQFILKQLIIREYNEKPKEEFKFHLKKNKINQKEDLTEQIQELIKQKIDQPEQFQTLQQNLEFKLKQIQPKLSFDAHNQKRIKNLSKPLLFQSLNPDQSRQRKMMIRVKSDNFLPKISEYKLKSDDEESNEFLSLKKCESLVNVNQKMKTNVEVQPVLNQQRKSKTATQILQSDFEQASSLFCLSPNSHRALKGPTSFLLKRPQAEIVRKLFNQ